MSNEKDNKSRHLYFITAAGLEAKYYHFHFSNSVGVTDLSGTAEIHAEEGGEELGSQDKYNSIKVP